MADPTFRRLLALRTGVTAAAAVSAVTFARGLLPRSTTDQALATAVTAAYGMGAGTLAVSAIEATAELVAKRRGRGNPETATLLTAAALAAGGTAMARALPNTNETPLPIAAAQSAATILGGGALAATMVISSDRLTRTLGVKSGPVVGIATAAALGGITAAVRVNARDRRATRFGEPEGLASVDLPESNVGLARSLGIGAGVGAGLLVLAGGEYAVAEGSRRLVSRALGRTEPVTPLVGHAINAALLVPAGWWALDRLRRRLMHADEVVEPAYPDPPSSPFVTAGPMSKVAFDDIGKEGRRFVLMALSAADITAVMGEPARDPVRAVAGYDSAPTSRARAELALAELEALGAYDRAVIVVAAPTGVGYVNPTFAEALEYLTLGDCAIVVPQYALVPSALALNQTRAGVEMQTLILSGIRDRIADLPTDRRPRLLQFGESLGAQVALDVAAKGTHRFDELGLVGGLYLGTPFRTRLWDRWFTDPVGVDPAGMLSAVSSAEEIVDLPESVRHIQVIHNDDPINKFAYDAFVRAPWWLGAPENRPPGVPRETKFRPVVTFVICLVDLKNGMNSRPGEFMRRGHDYRIEFCDALRFGFDLPATAEQARRIEVALRVHERTWATRRMVARRFTSARSSVLGQLTSWGVDPASLGLDSASAARLARGEIDTDEAGPTDR